MLEEQYNPEKIESSIQSEWEKIANIRLLQMIERSIIAYPCSHIPLEKLIWDM